MSEKFVKISEELRDKYLRLLEELDLDSHNFSKQEGAGSHIENCQFCADIAELRAAPSVEMLDLGKIKAYGVITALGNPTEIPEKAFDYPQFKGREKLYRESDLQSLAKPEQSGGVVTEEMLKAVLKKWSEIDGFQTWFDSNRPMVDEMIRILTRGVLS